MKYSSDGKIVDVVTGEYIDWHDAYDKKNEYLSTYLSVSVMSMAHDIFDGHLQELNNKEMHRPCGKIKYTVGLKPNGSPVVHSQLLFSNLYGIDKCIGNKFALWNMCGYYGKAKNKRYASECYGIAIDLDYVRVKELQFLFLGIEEEIIPCPTYLVNSGHGVHLYYIFEKPIPLTRKNEKVLDDVKYDIIALVWTANTSLDSSIQYQSIYQDMRMPDSWTKFGYRNKKKCRFTLKAFKTGSKVDLLYLSKFINTDISVLTELGSDCDPKHISRQDAERLYPSWYKRVVIDGHESGYYIQNEGLYKWWYNIITQQDIRGDRVNTTSHEGNRYKCIRILFIMAYKCGIPFDTVLQDALNLVPFMNNRPHSSTNQFTEQDVLAASKSYGLKGVKLSNKGIHIETSITLPPPKIPRHHRPQSEHLKRARLLRSNLSSYENVGRPNAQCIVTEWQSAHPNGTKAQCIRDTGLSKPTVLKWWC